MQMGGGVEEARRRKDPTTVSKAMVGSPSFLVIARYHSKKSLLIVKLGSFQNASFEIEQIFFLYQQNRFSVKRLICKIQNKNSFSDRRFLFDSEKKSLYY